MTRTTSRVSSRFGLLACAGSSLVAARGPVAARARQATPPTAANPAAPLYAWDQKVKPGEQYDENGGTQRPRDDSPLHAAVSDWNGRTRP